MVVSVRNNVEIWRPISVLALIFIPDMCQVNAENNFSAARTKKEISKEFYIHSHLHLLYFPWAG